MTNPYQEIFKAQGSFLFSLFGFIARMPMSMIPIGILAMLNQLDYSYGKAGFFVAINVISSAIFAPYLSRLADRYGQSRIVLFGSSVTILSLCIFIFIANYYSSLFLLILFAIGSGCVPHFGAFVRTRWSTIYKKSDRLRSAFAFESILDEIVYIIGPVITLSLATTLAPSSGLFVALLFLIIGSIGFWFQKKTQPKPNHLMHSDRTSAIRILEIRLLVFTLLFLGISYGAIEVTVLAFAKSLNQATYAGFSIAAYACGSLISGIIYGLKKWPLSLPKQLVYLTTIDFFIVLPLYLVTNIYNLSFILFLAGLVCAPLIIISISLVETIVPSQKLTEGMAWVSTGMIIGTSFGNLLSGLSIDHYGASSGFSIITAGAFFVALSGFSVYRQFLKK